MTLQTSALIFAVATAVMMGILLMIHWNEREARIAYIIGIGCAIAGLFCRATKIICDCN